MKSGISVLSSIPFNIHSISTDKRALFVRMTLLWQFKRTSWWDALQSHTGPKLLISRVPAETESIQNAILQLLSRRQQENCRCRNKHYYIYPFREKWTSLHCLSVDDFWILFHSDMFNPSSCVHLQYWHSFRIVRTSALQEASIGCALNVAGRTSTWRSRNLHAAPYKINAVQNNCYPKAVIVLQICKMVKWKRIGDLDYET